VGEVGGLHQAAGESPIDNTVLPNIMTSAESKVLLTGGMMKGMLIRKMGARQTKILVALAEHFRSTPGHPEQYGRLHELGAVEVKEALSHWKEWDAEMLKTLGIPTDSFSWEVLVERGEVVASYGQLSIEHKKNVHMYLKAELAPNEEEVAASESKEEDKLGAFVEWCKKNPGKTWQDDTGKHKELLMLVFMSNKYQVLKRTDVEKHTRHRFLAVEWDRNVPLKTLEEDGTEKVVRPCCQEYSRLRKNAFPYADSHGLGISSGGIAENTVTNQDKDGDGKVDNTSHSLAYQLGTALPEDSSAKLGNWFLTDIEKILSESKLLSPSGPPEHWLPCEELHEVGQNPRAASSIGETQHTQICRSSVEDWPVFQLEHRPLWCPDLQAYLDMCQVGYEADAFYVKLKTRDPAFPPIVAMLQELRMTCMKEFGPKSVDFNCWAAPQGDGWFVVIFAPLAAIECDKSTWTCMNKDLNQAETEFSVPCGTVDSSQGKGNIMLFGDEKWALGMEGAKVLARLYDFNRKPGSRRVVQSFLLERYAYMDKIERLHGPVKVMHAPKLPVFSTSMGGTSLVRTNATTT